jgi:hypothetical protein
MSRRQRHLPQLGLKEQLGPLEAVAAVPDQPRITRVDGYDVVKVGDEGGLMAADHLIRAGTERNLGPGVEIDAMNPGDEPFRIAAENAHAGGQWGGGG